MSKKDKPKTMNDIREMYGLPRIENNIIYNDYWERVQEKDKEIERLNNIINELEKYLEKIIINGGTRGSMTFWYRQIYDYLQELKGSDSNE